ncbi:hypothetical protein [uncultured Rubinisphaera sp.]|uniref:hypothetical protein n=1 Tax=uncultured Rubinisphaera sp. TaxID=1678686 RepID=UPI0030D89E88
MKAGFDLGITDAEHQQTTKLAEVQQQFQQVKYGIEGYSQSAYDYAGLAVETYVDEYGNPITYESSAYQVAHNEESWRLSLIPEHHDRYISWKEFESIQTAIENNRLGDDRVGTGTCSFLP